MRRIVFLLALVILAQLVGMAWGAGADAVPPTDGTAVTAGPDGAAASPGADSTDTLKQELDKLKREITALEERLKTQEQQNQLQKKQQPALAEVATSIRELDQRVSETERGQALDRLRFSGDYRFETHSIIGKVPAHFDGMQLQNLVVKTMFAMPILGRPPASVAEINKTVSSNYANYLQFTNGLTFNQLKQGMSSFPAPMQQQLFGTLMPSTLTSAYNDNNAAMFTNRLRLNFDAETPRGLEQSQEHQAELDLLQGPVEDRLAHGADRGFQLVNARGRGTQPASRCASATRL